MSFISEESKSRYAQKKYINDPFVTNDDEIFFNEYINVAVGFQFEYHLIKKEIRTILQSLMN